MIQKTLASFLAFSIVFPAAGLAQTAPTVPTPEQLRQAHAFGEGDGAPDGAREGSERGDVDGRTTGRREGDEKGYSVCREEQARRAYDDGYRNGLPQGELEGQRQGRLDGQRAGDREGTQQGLASGERQADTDAERAATPAGERQGHQEAENSDARDRGRRDGLIAGDRDAQAEALRVDYPRGRKAVYDEMFAQPIESHDRFSQRPQALAESANSEESGSFMALGVLGPQADQLEVEAASELGASSGTIRVPAPDFRYKNWRRNFPTGQETQSYQEGYKKGYTDGHVRSYAQVYPQAYRTAYDRAHFDGCNRARNQSYAADRDRGHREGYEAGYSSTYRPAYDRAYRVSYDSAFSTSYRQAYDRTYPRAYERHFEIARSRAYQDRVNQLYQAAYSQARNEKYREVYPRYAQEQYQRGRADETRDFEARPVRLLDALVTETNNNGLFEPGEPLRVTAILRSFSLNSTPGRTVRLEVQDLDAQNAQIVEGSASLVSDLKRKSQTTVTDALELRLNESAVRKATRLRIVAYLGGVQIGSKDLSVQALFKVDVSMANRPELKEGVEAPIKIRVSNQSTAPSTRLVLNLSAPPSALRITQGRVELPSLQPGETREVEFKGYLVISEGSVRVPLLVDAVEGQEARRVGLLNLNQDLPVSNELRLVLNSDIRTLRGTGITRVEYVVKNVSNRPTVGSLQLKAALTGPNADNFRVIGPNPQYVRPLRPGESLSFVVPLLSREANSGGSLELELQENGRTNLKRKLDF